MIFVKLSEKKILQNMYLGIVDVILWKFWNDVSVCGIVLK